MNATIIIGIHLQDIVLQCLPNIISEEQKSPISNSVLFPSRFSFKFSLKRFENHELPPIEMRRRCLTAEAPRRKIQTMQMDIHYKRESVDSFSPVNEARDHGLPIEASHETFQEDIVGIDAEEAISHAPVVPETPLQLVEVIELETAPESVRTHRLDFIDECMLRLRQLISD